MSGATSIQWTDATWNPVRGCSRVSAGCERCYAERVAHRFSGPGKPFEGLTVAGPKGPRWTGKVRLVPEVLEQPLRWRKPRRIFVNSMSDLFHEDVPDEFIDRVFGVMACAPHTFQILTKRPERMHAYLREHAAGGRHVWAAAQTFRMPRGQHKPDRGWPLPNVWLGVSCEDQAAADERIPILLQTRAAVRFVSAEPLLGHIDFGQVRNSVSMAEGQNWIDALGGRCWTCSGPDYYDTTPADAALDWVIVGGESGPGARPCDVSWIRSIVGQCRDAGVAGFVKQLGADVRDVNDAGFEGVERGEWPDGTCTVELPGSIGWQGERIRVRLHDRAGSDPSEWPEDLRVRQFPKQVDAA